MINTFADPARGPQVGLRTRRRIVVEIDELALEGFPHVDRDRLAAAFERELTRLLRQGPDGAGLIATPVDQARDVVSGLPALPATASARRLGAALAHAVHRGLTREEDGAFVVRRELLRLAGGPGE